MESLIFHLTLVLHVCVDWMFFMCALRNDFAMFAVFQYSIGGLIYNAASQSTQNGQSSNYYSQVHTLPTGATPQPPPLVRTSTASNVNLTANMR
jgi:hypothetical protein